MTPKITDSVLQKITSQHVTQKPAWYFWAQTALYILGGVVFLGIGIFASTSLFLLTSDLPFMALWRSHSLLKLILLGFPIIWVLIAVALGTLAVWLSRQTEGAYRYRWQWVLVAAIIFQSFIGYGLAHSQFGEQIETFVGHHLQQKARMEAWRQEAWRQPEAGLMVGKIKSFTPELVVLQPPRGPIWHIDITQAKPLDIASLAVGEFIRCHGHIHPDNPTHNVIPVFVADKILLGKPKRNKHAYPPRDPRKERLD